MEGRRRRTKERKEGNVELPLIDSCKWFLMSCDGRSRIPLFCDQNDLGKEDRVFPAL